ncbi:hypothetical protein M3Y97_00980900 [Aphelenchoides bicaudatus]|nr:hypothetical protein M3Y97_00980900 [Aphelenchoides bicaudatus]
MYRAKILGIRLPSTVTQKPVDELAITSGSRLSNDSGYIDEGNGKTSQQTASTAKSLEDWRTSGTLEQLAELQINDQLDKKETNLNEANKVTETLEDAQLKQKEDALRLQRELFSSIANQKPPTDVVSKTLRALDADESVTSNSIKNQVNDSALTNQVEEDRNLNDIAESEEDPVKNLLSPNRDKISDEEWRKLNTPRDKLEEEKRDDPPSTLLQVERISLIPPTPRKEDIQKKKVLKDLEFKRQHKDSSSTDSSSLDTEAEQQKLSEMGSTSTLDFVYKLTA